MKQAVMAFGTIQNQRMRTQSMISDSLEQIPGVVSKET